MIQLTVYENMFVQCRAGTNGNDAIRVAQDFCETFEVKSIIIHWNDYFIQVTSRGVQIPEDLRDESTKSSQS